MVFALGLVCARWSLCHSDSLPAKSGARIYEGISKTSEISIKTPAAPSETTPLFGYWGSPALGCCHIHHHERVMDWIRNTETDLLACCTLV